MTACLPACPYSREEPASIQPVCRTSVVDSRELSARWFACHDLRYSLVNFESVCASQLCPPTPNAFKFTQVAASLPRKVQTSLQPSRASPLFVAHIMYSLHRPLVSASQLAFERLLSCVYVDHAPSLVDSYFCRARITPRAAGAGGQDLGLSLSTGTPDGADVLDFGWLGCGSTPFAALSDSSMCARRQLEVLSLCLGDGGLGLVRFRPVRL